MFLVTFNAYETSENLMFALNFNVNKNSVYNYLLANLIYGNSFSECIL